MNKVIKKVMSFDNLMAMNLIGLGVLGSSYAVKMMVIDIPAMTQTMKPKKLVPLEQVIEFPALAKLAQNVRQ